jgi:hypothetical protein
MIKQITCKNKQLFLVSLLFICLFLSKAVLVKSQATLVENSNEFRVFVGSEFDLVVPKNVGPEVNYEVDDWGTVKLKFNYLSEYYSPTSYLSSLTQLIGKGYSFDYINWYRYGLSESARTYVNSTRANLDQGLGIDFSVVVFNENTTINNYEITRLKTTFVELKITNWTRSSYVNGLALNIISYMLDDNKNYLRLGPYVDLDNTDFNAFLLWYETTSFTFHFQKFITIITDEDETELINSNSFQTYNPAEERNSPVDFWISIPFLDNIEQIIFRFVCNFGTIATITPTSNFLRFYSIVATLFLTLIPIRIISNKRRAKNG